MLSRRRVGFDGSPAGVPASMFCQTRCQAGQQGQEYEGSRPEQASGRNHPRFRSRVHKAGIRLVGHQIESDHAMVREHSQAKEEHPQEGGQVQQHPS